MVTIEKSNIDGHPNRDRAAQQKLRPQVKIHYVAFLNFIWYKFTSSQDPFIFYIVVLAVRTSKPLLKLF